MTKKILLIAMLCLLSGCGGDDDLGNCRFVRFIPEQGESYYEYVCDDRTDNVRYIPEAPETK